MTKLHFFKRIRTKPTHFFKRINCILPHLFKPITYFRTKKTLDGELRPRNAKYNDNILIFVQNLFFDLILHTFSLEKYHSPFLHSLGTTWLSNFSKAISLLFIIPSIVSCFIDATFYQHQFASNSFVFFVWLNKVGRIGCLSF